MHYFLDEAQEYEIATISQMLDYADRPNWERARMQMYITAQSVSSKKLKPQDIIQFAWDKEGQSIEISNEDIERIRAKQDEFRAILERRKSKNIVQE